MKGPLQLRRGLAVIYLAGGVIHGATMALAAAYSLGRLPVVIPASVWSELYYAHFLFMVLGGGLYLGLGFRRDGLFYAESLLDFVAGIGVFVPLFSLVAVLLVNRWVPAWTALAPSAFLVAYGLGLAKGRRMGFLEP